MTTESTSTATATATVSTARTDSSKYTGRVKWFNNKFGYGFITVVSTGADASAAIGSDVFAHHSEVSVGEDQYRYLVQGEYVEFGVIKTTSGNHEFQCSAIRGIHGGQLICETRHTAREQYNKSASTASGASNLSTSTSTLPRPGSHSGEHRFSGVRPASTRGGFSGGASGRGGFSGGASGRGGRGGGSGSGSSSGGVHN